MVAVTHPTNKISQHVLEKAGMRLSKLGQYHGLEQIYYEIDKKIGLS